MGFVLTLNIVFLFLLYLIIPDCFVFHLYTRRGLRGRVVNASRFETTSPGFEYRGSCQLLTECCWFNLRNNLFLQLWKLTSIYYEIWLKITYNTNSLLTPVSLFYLHNVLAMSGTYVHVQAILTMAE